MKKTLVAIFVLGFLVTIPFDADAYVGFGFGGRVKSLNDNVPEILDAKAQGYSCHYSGELLEVEPVNRSSPAVTYYAASTSQKTTTHSLRMGQYIIGLYFRPLPVVCTKPGDPPSQKTIFIKSLTIFGTSR